MIDKDVTDEEWREERFDESTLISARLSKRHGEVTFKELKDYIEKYGPDGVLDTAVLLPRKDFEELERLCGTQEKPKRARRRHA